MAGAVGTREKWGKVKLEEYLGQLFLGLVSHVKDVGFTQRNSEEP